MADIGTLTARIGLDTRPLGRGLRQAGGMLRGFTRNVTTLGGVLGPVQSAVAGLGVTLGGLLELRNIVQVGSRFEVAMETVAGVTRATAEEMDLLTETAREMGETTKFSATQAADALKFLGQTGFSAAESVSALPGVLDLAAAAEVELGRAADIASNALKAFQLPVKELGDVNDVFVGTITRSNVNMEQLAESFRYAAPIANAFGYSIEETAGLIGKLGDAGIQGSMAGTQLAMAIQRAADVANEFNLPSSDLVDVLDELTKRGASATDIMELFGIRAGRAALIIKDSTEEVREFQQELFNVGGEAKDLAERKMATVEGAFLELKSVMESVRISAFDQFKDSLEAAVRAITTFIRNNSDVIMFIVRTLETAIKTIVKIIGVIITPAAAFLGGALLGIRDASKRAKDSVDRVVESSGRLKQAIVELAAAEEEMRKAGDDAKTSIEELQVATINLKKAEIAVRFQEEMDLLKQEMEKLENPTFWEGLLIGFDIIWKNIQTNLDFIGQSISDRFSTLWEKLKLIAREGYEVTKQLGLAALDAIRFDTAGAAKHSAAAVAFEEMTRKKIDDIQALFETREQQRDKEKKAALFKSNDAFRRKMQDNIAERMKFLISAHAQTFADLDALAAKSFKKPPIPTKLTGDEDDEALKRLRESQDAQVKAFERMIARTVSGYDALLSSQTLTRDQLIDIWDEYEKARGIQIDRETNKVFAATGNRALAEQLAAKSRQELAERQLELAIKTASSMEQIMLEAGRASRAALGETFFRAMKGDFEGFLDFLENIFDRVFRRIADNAANVISDAIARALIPKGGGGDFGAFLAGFIGFQHGGLVTQPTLGVVGEAGPELVIPLSKAKEMMSEGEDQRPIINLTQNITTPDVRPFQQSRQQIANQAAVALALAARRNQ
jgi:TP901 family phage tail tape measure protein